MKPEMKQEIQNRILKKYKKQRTENENKKKNRKSKGGKSRKNP